jgi:hypothetical protein
MKIDMNQVGAVRAYVQRAVINIGQGLCEFIDNSLSAGASVIKIEFLNGILEISDNGCGTLNPEFILTPFKSYGMDATSKYGVGAACSVIVLSDWGECVATSSTGDGNSKTCIMNWGSYKSKVEGDIELTRVTSIRDSSSPGTLVSLEFPKIVPNDRHDRNKKDIAFRYSTALRNGVQIHYNVKGRTEALQPWNPPELSKKEKQVINHPQFGRIELLCGIVKAGHKNEHPGFNVYWGKRILIEQESGPCAVHEASTSRIYGEIILDHNKFPHVNTLKDGFNNDFDPTELWEEVAELFKDLLIAAKTEGVSMELEVLSRKASEYINGALGGGDTGKEKRDKQPVPSRGPEESEKTERTRKTAEKVSGSGDVKPRNRARGLPMRIKLTPNTTLDESFKCQYNAKFWDVQYNPDRIPKQILKSETLGIFSLSCIAQSWAKKCEVDEKGNMTLPNFGNNSFEMVLTGFLQALMQQKSLSLVG